MGEHDGGTEPEDGTPYAIPVISNVTYIGAGAGAFPQGDGAEAIIFRDNAVGKYSNSIIIEYNGANGGKAITVEDLAAGEDSRARMEAGDLVLSNNIWWQFGAGNDLAAMVPQDFARAHFSANNNQIVGPRLNQISRTNDGGLDPRPNPAGLAASGAAAPDDPFFTQVSYYGAFNPDAPLWINGWTGLAREGILSETTTGIAEEHPTSDGAVPASFGLGQNYPNPFNPSTNISYDVARSGFVSIVVFNQLGRQIGILAQGYRQAGRYTVTWQAEDLPGGIYYYRMQTASGGFPGRCCWSAEPPFRDAADPVELGRSLLRRSPHLRRRGRDT